MTEEEKKLQQKLKSVEIYADLAKNAIWERYKLLPLISSLAATLLVVATFNESLFPLTSFVKTLIVILLLIIPVSIIGFLHELHESEKNAFKKLKEISDGTEKRSLNDLQKAIKPYFRNYIPWIMAAILTAVIFCIIFLTYYYL